MYKNRIYEEIVTVEKKEENQQVKFEVKFDETKLTVGKTLEKNERFTEFKTLVSRAVNNLQKNLDEYAQHEFLRDLYTCPEKIQNLKNEFKKQLTTLKTQRKLTRTEKKQIRETRKKLNSIKTFNKEAKKVAANDFGIMTAKTVNNAIASWCHLFRRSKDPNTKRWVSDSIIDSKDNLQYWESKLNYLATFKSDIDEDEIQRVEGIVKKHRKRLVSTGNAAAKNLGRSEVKNFVSNIEKARVDMEINKKNCSPYARLGMMKLCCDMIDAFDKGGQMGRLQDMESTSRKVGRTMVAVGLGVGLSVAGVLCIGGMIGLLGIASPVLFLPGMLLGLAAVELGPTSILAGYGVAGLGAGVFAMGKSAGKRMFGTKQTKKRNRWAVKNKK